MRVKLRDKSNYHTTIENEKIEDRASPEKPYTKKELIIKRSNGEHEGKRRKEGTVTERERNNSGSKGCQNPERI